MTTPNPHREEEMREEFEAWWRKHPSYFSDADLYRTNSGSYQSALASRAWEGWQAATSRASAGGCPHDDKPHVHAPFGYVLSEYGDSVPAMNAEEHWAGIRAAAAPEEKGEGKDE